MPKVTAATLAVTALIVLGLTGCAGTPESAPSKSPSEGTETEEITEPPTTADGEAEAADSIDITAAGEVCDPGNANDVICAAFHPDQAVANIASRNEVLSTMAASDVVALAQQACSVLASGGNYETTSLAPGNDNRSIFSAGALSYCPEYSQGSEQYPDLIQRCLAYYQSIGEAAAKAEFADGTMPTPEKLGY